MELKEKKDYFLTASSFPAVAAHQKVNTCLGRNGEREIPYALRV